MTIVERIFDKRFLYFHLVKVCGLKKVLSWLVSLFVLRQYEIVRKYADQLKGKSGLEIGGPTRMFEKGGLFPIYPVVKSIDVCNLDGALEGVTMVCDATDLGRIASGTYDFVIASHTIEHIANPLKALSEWLRLLNEGGILFLVVPHKAGTFDHKRSVTSLSHLIEDFKNNVKEDDQAHVFEALELADPKLTLPPSNYESLRKKALNSYEGRHMHLHVYNAKLLIEVLDYLNTQILFVDVVLPFHIFIMAQKVNSQIVQNAEFLSAEAEYKRRSPFLETEAK